jgi:hypothetical protein
MDDGEELAGCGFGGRVEVLEVVLRGAMAGEDEVVVFSDWRGGKSFVSLWFDC